MSLTQQEFAREIGFSLRSVQAWELGESRPRPRAIRAIADVTETPLDWFLEDVA